MIAAAYPGDYIFFLVIFVSLGLFALTVYAVCKTWLRKP